MRDPSHHEDQVYRAVSNDLVGDVDVSAPSVPDRRDGVLFARRLDRRRHVVEGDATNRSDEAVAPSVSGFDVAGRTGVVIERPPDFPHADLQRAVRDVHAGPDRVEQFLLRDQSA